MFRTSLLLVVLLAFAAAGCAAAPAAPPRPKSVSFAIHTAMDYETPGYGKTRVPLEDPKARQEIWVNPKVEINEMDVEDADLTHIWTGPTDKPRQEAAVAVTMTSAGRKKLKALTTARGYSRLALFVNNRLVMAPYVRSPITDGKMLLFGHMTEAEALRLAVALSGRRPEPQFKAPPQ